MSLEHYLKNVKKLTNTQIGDFKRLFNQMTKDSSLAQFRFNVWLECRFDETLWRQIEDAVNVASTYGMSAPIELQHRVMMVFRTAQWQGNLATVAPDTVFGCAVRRPELIQRWTRILKKTPHAVAKILRNAINKGPGELVSVFGQKEIGEYVIWSTFDPDNPADGPFKHKLPTSKDGIACCLGLELSSDPFIIMEYTLPSQEPIHIPTIANAYAGRQWQPFFRPLCPDSEDNPFSYGETWPNPNPPGGIACPEVVHRPITAQDLVTFRLLST